VRQKFPNLQGKTVSTLKLFLNRMHVFLQGNLLRSMRHLDIGDPILVGLGPIGSATVTVSMPEQKGQQNLARNP
jgi:hypothetical protein